MAAALTRSVNRDLERLRADFNKQLELVRYELNREAHKADLVANKRHELYPETLEQLKAAHRVLQQYVEQEMGAFRTPGSGDTAKHAISELRDRLELKSLHFGEEVRTSALSAVQGLERVVKAVQDRRFSALGISESRDSPYSPPRRAIAEVKTEITKVEELMRRELEAAPTAKPPS